MNIKVLKAMVIINDIFFGIGLGVTLICFSSGLYEEAVLLGLMSVLNLLLSQMATKNIELAKENKEVDHE